MSTLSPTESRRLTRANFHRLAAVPPEDEWFANLANTWRAYKNDVIEFMRFVSLAGRDELRLVSRAHVIGWRHAMVARNLTPATIRRKLSALSALFTHLCDANAVALNPVHGVKRAPTRVKPPHSAMGWPACCSRPR